MAGVEFENNFDDLLNKPSSNTISETLSEMDVSNPFRDVVSPLIAQEESSDTEVNDHSILVNKNGVPSSVNPLESSHFQTPRLDEREFEDVDVSSEKGIDAISSVSTESHITEKSISEEESFDDETAIRKVSNDRTLANLGYATGQSDLQSKEYGTVPIFKLTVEDPQKIGDPINAHIIYKVRTRTTSTTFRSQDFTVLRRYRDFLWLYNRLTLSNPGAIVPPVPEKHAIGRFQDEFVENRRQALEKCLNKVTSHPILYRDPDLKLFLESDNFTIDVKRKNHESKGVLKSLGEAMSNATTFNKFTETDEWFESRRNQLDVLESQLKTLLKSVEAIVKQRKDLGGATVDFGSSLLSLAGAEHNKTLANNLTILGNLQQKIRELHENQARQDVITLENTIEEYIRIIGSIKVAFNSRAKFHQTWQNSVSDLQKRKANYERSQGRFSQDKITMMSTQIAEAENKVEDCKNEFEDVSKLIKDELDRFDKEKIEDFKNSVEAFLESMVQTHKEIINLWESFFLQVEAQQNSHLEDNTAVTT